MSMFEKRIAPFSPPSPADEAFARHVRVVKRWWFKKGEARPERKGVPVKPNEDIVPS